MLSVKSVKSKQPIFYIHIEKVKEIVADVVRRYGGSGLTWGVIDSEQVLRELLSLTMCDSEFLKVSILANYLRNHETEKMAGNANRALNETIRLINKAKVNDTSTYGQEPIDVVLETYEIDPTLSDVLLSRQNRFRRGPLINALRAFGEKSTNRPMYCEAANLFQLDFGAIHNRELAFRRFCFINESNVIVAIQPGSLVITENEQSIVVTAKVKPISSEIPLSTMTFGMRAIRMVRIDDREVDMHNKCISDVKQIITWDVIS